MNSPASVRLAFLFALLAGCKDSPEDEARAARAEERLNLVSNPSLYLHAGDRQYAAADGGPNDAQLTALTVYNGSHFPVSDLHGDAIWLDEQDRRLGSTSFVLRGGIPANAVRRFTIVDGTMTSSILYARAANVELVFTRVQVESTE
jgi:hypothetical protein